MTNDAPSLSPLSADQQHRLATLLLRLLGRWSRIGDYLAALHPALPDLTPARQQQHERTLYDTETLQLALFLVRRHHQGGEPYTLNQLAGMLEIDEGLRKSLKQRLREIVLPRIADHYGLFAYQRPTNPHAGNECYRIWATQRLLDFFAGTLGPELQTLIEEYVDDD